MSKELKALERVKNFMSNNAVHWKQDIAMIETALKDYERVMQEKNSLMVRLSQNTEKLKAFEIIKDRISFKLVRVQEVNDVNELEKPNPKWSYHYYINTPYHSWEITKEEYDLLTEVLK